MKQIFFGLAVCLFWLISAEAQERYQPERLGRGRLVFEKSLHAIELEVALTESARAKGLMFRESLA
ncbi:MAG TPA: hypothetical protein DCZ48_01195, partial [Methylococcaceae bacterium]|nr:hypothetical protein [Methylococcaceae bacterium]